MSNCNDFTYGTAQLKLDTHIAKLVIFSMSLGETRAHLMRLLHAHACNVLSIVNCKSVSSRSLRPFYD